MTMLTDMRIRSAKPEDIEKIIDLCELHAIYEKSEYTKDGKAETLSMDLFSSSPKLYCLVVESNSELIAYVTYMKQYATWDADEYIYIDCLYVKENFRSQGIGEQLVNRIKEEGTKLGCKRVQWQTPDFNFRAIKFYNRISATSKKKERFILNL